ncbi:MAG: ROK family protein [Ilumatobacteraceae bacterium]
MQRGYLAIDVGTSRLAAGVVDADGNVVVRDRITTPQRNVWPALSGLVRRVMAANPTEIQPGAVGVTCPGPIDRGTGAMKPVGMPMWHDFPLRRELAAITGLNVSVDTAGRGLALAELWCGAAATLEPPAQDFATLVLGDDVDGGLVVRGALAQGLTGNLGQFGHLIVEPDGIVCVCGAVGCLTAYAGARGIEASTGRDLRRTPPAIVERTGIMVGRACASMAAMLDVSLVVIGGIVPSVFGVPFFDAVGHELDQRSGLRHLDAMRVRGIGNTRVGPLVAAAAVAHHSVLDRSADPSPPSGDVPVVVPVPNRPPLVGRGAGPAVVPVPRTGRSDLPAGNTRQ